MAHCIRMELNNVILSKELKRATCIFLLDPRIVRIWMVLLEKHIFSIPLVSEHHSCIKWCASGLNMFDILSKGSTFCSRNMKCWFMKFGEYVHPYVTPNALHDERSTHYTFLGMLCSPWSTNSIVDIFLILDVYTIMLYFIKLLLDVKKYTLYNMVNMNICWKWWPWPFYTPPDPTLS